MNFHIFKLEKQSLKRLKDIDVRFILVSVPQQNTLGD